jgi:hypothetical protein
MMQRLFLKKLNAGFLGLLYKGTDLSRVHVFGPSLPMSQVGLYFKGKVTRKGPRKNTYFVLYEGSHSALISADASQELTEGQEVVFQVTHDKNLREPHKGIKGRVCVRPLNFTKKHWLDAVIETLYSTDQVVCQEVTLVSLIQEKYPKIPVSYVPAADFFVTDGLEEDWEDLLTTTVVLEGSGSLSIESTDLGVCVDVNQSSLQHPSRASVKKINQMALEALVKHISLRNLVGLILIDFIDFETRQDAFFFLEKVKRSIGLIGGCVLGYTKGGLIEITRPRVGFPLADLVALEKEM